MRTNIIMEEPLVYAAQKATGIKTKTGVVHYALREVVRRQQMKELLKLRGKVKFWDGYVEEHVRPRSRSTRQSDMLVLPDTSAWISFLAGIPGPALGQASAGSSIEDQTMYLRPDGHGGLAGCPIRLAGAERSSTVFDNCQLPGHRP